MVSLVRVVGVLTVALGSSLAQATDWPTFMQDNARVGQTDESLSLPLTEYWVHAENTAPERAWPGPGGKVIEGKELRHRVSFDDVFHVALVDGRVYFGSSIDGRVHCLDAKTHEPQWSFFTGGPVRLVPTIYKGRVYFGSDDGYVYCLNATDGSIAWKLRAGPRDERILARGRMASRWPVRTGVLIDQGIAYFGAGIFPHESVALYAVDAKSGRVIWKNDTISQRDAGRNDLTPQGYLLATKDILFVPSGRTLPAAIDRKTGQMIHKAHPSWRSSAGGQIGGTGALLADGQMYSVGEHHILALSQDKGDVGFGWFQARQMTLAGDSAYMANGKDIVAVDRLKYAVASRKRHRLEQSVNKLKRALYFNPGRKDLQAVQELNTQLKAAKLELKKLDDAKKQETDAYKTAKSSVEKLEKDLVAAAERYEVSRKDYEAKKEQLVASESELKKLSNAGLKWRSASPHESRLVLTKNVVVAGGRNQVAAYDVASGEQVWSANVDGEARGLAVSDGRLLVSTTAGKIYCFGSLGEKPQAIAETPAVTNPYADLPGSELYQSAADSIVQRSGADQGFCLVVGSEQGRLAYELAKRTKLQIYCIEADAEKVSTSRKLLTQAGLYGSRIFVDQVDVSVLPHPNYFANLIVSDTLLLTGKVPGDPREIGKRLKPVGGLICLGLPEQASATALSAAPASVSSWLAGTELAAEDAAMTAAEGWSLLRRGPLPDTDSWSHQYGTAANTSSNSDHRVRGGLSVLWYGDPGPNKMLNRHQGAVGPVSAGGRLFVQGDKSVMAYDAYNGQFLWEMDNPGAIRTGVFNNYEPGNLVASEDALFVVIGDRCQHIDAATGKLVRTYSMPKGADDGKHQWGYVAYKDGLLYGSATERKLIAEAARRRGRPSETAASDKVFAIDVKSGKLAWTYRGQSISHTTIAIGDQHVYFVDSSITPEQRAAMLKQDKSELAKLTGKEREVAEDRIKNYDLRRAVAVDSKSGEQIWAEAVDVTDCTGVGIGAGKLTLMYQNNHVVLCGANANGHYWRQFLAGDFKRRRLVALSAFTGEKLWSKDANYRHRPIIVENRIIAEPWAYDLYTGKQEMRTHPLTGEQTAWKFARPGHHCGAISATPNMMFFRSGFTAYYDLKSDSGTRHFAGHRLGCWINSIPAGGLVMIPEASAGCVCLFSLASTVVFEPRNDRQVWGVYSAEGVATPVQHMAVNFGAPGDRRDAHGKLWLSFPRPSSRKGIDLNFNLEPKFAAGGQFFTKNSESVKVAGTQTPWIYASGASGLSSCKLPLVGKGEEPATYTVRLYFTNLEADKAGERVFDILLQGKPVEKELDIAKVGGRGKRAVVREFQDIQVSDNLLVETIAGENSKSPVISAIEVIRSGDAEITKLAN